MPAARQNAPASRGHTADYRGANEVRDSWRGGLETGVRRMWLELHAIIDQQLQYLGELMDRSRLPAAMT